jgi:hypothetical protein
LRPSVGPLEAPVRSSGRAAGVLPAGADLGRGARALGGSCRRARRAPSGRPARQLAGAPGALPELRERSQAGERRERRRADRGARRRRAAARRGLRPRPGGHRPRSSFAARAAGSGGRSWPRAGRSRSGPGSRCGEPSPAPCSPASRRAARSIPSSPGSARTRSWRSCAAGPGGRAWPTSRPTTCGAPSSARLWRPGPTWPVQQLAGHRSVTTTARYDRRPEAARRSAARRVRIPYVPRG